MFKWVDPMTEFGKIAFSFLIGALLMALLIDRCGNKPSGEVIVPQDTTSYSVILPPPKPETVQPAKPVEVIKVVYRDRWREWSGDTIIVRDTIIKSVCDSLMQFRTYELKAGSEKVDITANIKVLGYLDSSRIDWMMNIPEVRMPEPKPSIFIGGFAGKTYGGHLMYQKGKVIYYCSFDNQKEFRMGVAFGF